MGNKRSFSRLFVIDIAAAALLFGLIAGVVLDRKVINTFVPPEAIEKDAIPSFQLMAQAWNTITKFYIDQASISDQKLSYGAVKGMVDSLGDKGHSRFLTPEMIEQLKRTVRGRFVGIGVELQMKDGLPTVVAPIDNSPASQAGIKAGDVLLKANGRDLSGLTLEEVVKIVQGAPGTSVTLEVRTPETGTSRELKLKRRRLTVQALSWSRVPGTDFAHIRLSSFARGASSDLIRTLKSVLGDGGTSAIILDVRNNPGGLLEEAIGTASQFLRGGTVVRVRSPKGEVEQMHAEGKATAPAIPMVVLINNGTASAAEIVAGALQDRERATLIGETTVGTGTVLKQFPLSDGSALLLAVYEWLTPSGRVIWHKGIQPDIEVKLPRETKPVLPRDEKRMTPDQLQKSGDNHLLRAIEFLKDESERGDSR